jgi:hypothetical protein
MAEVIETANNNTFATATNLGNILNSLFVRGDLFGLTKLGNTQISRLPPCNRHHAKGFPV